MENMNISAVTDTAMETTTTSAPKHKWLSKLTRGAKKATMFCTIAGVMATTCATQAFAAGGSGAVDTSSFITTACTVLKSVICLIGGGVSLWGIVNLLEGYGNDNPGAKDGY